MCLKCHPLFTVERRKKFKFYFACTHTRTYINSLAIIFICVITASLSLTRQQQKSTKVKEKAEEMEAIEEGVSWNIMLKRLLVEWKLRLQKMEIMKILRKGDLGRCRSEIWEGFTIPCHLSCSRFSKAPNSTPLHHLYSSNVVCVLVSRLERSKKKWNSMLACNQSIYMIKRFPSSSSFSSSFSLFFQPPSPLDFLHRRFLYRSRVKCEVYWWWYNEQELPLWPAILLIPLCVI